jgi:hypothetical protein
MSYSLIPNTDCEATLDVMVDGHCLGSVWMADAYGWEACDGMGNPVLLEEGLNHSLFDVVQVLLNQSPDLEPDYDDSLPDWADYYANFSDYLKAEEGH